MAMDVHGIKGVEMSKEIKYEDKLSTIEINQEGHPDIKNMVKVDGKRIKGVRNVKIEYGVSHGFPVVTLEFYAIVKGIVKNAKVLSKITIPEKELPYVFHKKKRSEKRKEKKKKKDALGKESFVLHRKGKAFVEES